MIKVNTREGFYHLIIPQRSKLEYQVLQMFPNKNCHLECLNKHDPKGRNWHTVLKTD